MSAQTPVTVCVDAMGGDHAPDAVLVGIAAAIKADSALNVIVTGSSEVVEPFASQHRGRVTAVVANEIIEMGDHPAQAVRAKRDSSIVVGCRLVKDGHAHAFFSAGSTGAAMAAATLVIGRIRGISRPAIATVIPGVTTPAVLVDSGANADCRPEYLVEFARMGAAYSRIVLGVARPRVALLNIGGEPTKGSQLAVEAHALLAQGVEGFIGNIEGTRFMAGDADVIVTDGFTGNVALKLLEGTSKTLLSEVRDALTSTKVSSMAALAAKPALTRLRERLDPDEYGGAPLLGVNGLAVIGHGSSNARAVASALAVCARAVRGGLTEAIAATVTTA
jgi:glycerol-3-phosphate acyltransferase PlsX